MNSLKSKIIKQTKVNTELKANSSLNEMTNLVGNTPVETPEREEAPQQQTNATDVDIIIQPNRTNTANVVDDDNNEGEDDEEVIIQNRKLFFI
jgi:hypothetical protein